MARTHGARGGGKSVTVVGAGGNIGSHGVCHLARMPEVKRVVLIDREVYEKKNLGTQEITVHDIGDAKSRVQARRLRRINPELDVSAIHDAVENVPLGALRSDVILAGLDSRGARQYVSEAAWRLGTPWIDAGVDAGGLLARVNVYVPMTDAACLECAWNDRDYDRLEQTYPCRHDAAAPPATNAPSSLGALAASLQAIECQKLLAGKQDEAAVGRQILIDAAYHNYYVTTFRRNPQCRFDHEVWNTEKIGREALDLTLHGVFELAGTISERKGALALQVEGEVFVTKLTCTRCASTRELVRLRRRLTAKQRMCRGCGSQMAAGGSDMLDSLDARQLPPRTLGRSLRSLGFRAEDVFSVYSSDGETHYEIDGERT